jgi:hypothetical protein
MSLPNYMGYLMEFCKSVSKSWTFSDASQSLSWEIYFRGSKHRGLEHAGEKRSQKRKHARFVALCPLYRPEQGDIVGREYIIFTNFYVSYGKSLRE